MHRKEKRIFPVISFFFGLSYVFRFIRDIILAHVYLDENIMDFWYTLWFDVVSYVEGIAFIALLIQHHLSFREEKAAANQRRDSDHTS